MTRHKTTKPAAAGATTGLQGFDQLGSTIDPSNNPRASISQAPDDTGEDDETFFSRRPGISSRKRLAADPLVVFLARAEARAHLVAVGLHSLQDSVDKLQADAEVQGLVAKYGQEEIQQILSEAFGRWRLRDG
jgi:hypothetical protein